MAKYTKKPVTIEAVVYHGLDTTEMRNAFSERPQWLNEAIEKRIIRYDLQVGLVIATLEGAMCVSNDDYIIKGVKGEIYPCKPDIFEMSYDIAPKTLGGMLDEQR